MAQAWLKLAILLPEHSGSWNHRHAPWDLGLVNALKLPLYLLSILLVVVNFLHLPAFWRGWSLQFLLGLSIFLWKDGPFLWLPCSTIATCVWVMYFEHRCYVSMALWFNTWMLATQTPHLLPSFQESELHEARAAVSGNSFQWKETFPQLYLSLKSDHIY